MNNIQKNKQLMGNSVTQTLDDNNTVWSGSQLFSDTVQEHKDNMTRIGNWEHKQMEAMELRGLVRDKNLLRLVMIDAEMIRIISAIKALAAATNNNQLASSIDWNRSELLEMSDIAFNTAAGSVKSVADDNAAALVPYGITAQLLTTFGQDITAFDSIMKKPKALRGQIKTYTANLRTAVTKMLTTLREKMDNQVRSLYLNTGFASAYFNSRITYHYNENRTELRGTAKDNATGKHVRNVIIELVNYPSPGESIFRHTNKDGNYSFKQLDLTTATIRVRAVGYTTAEYRIPITQGHTNNFDIMLIPEPAPVTVPA